MKLIAHRMTLSLEYLRDEGYVPWEDMTAAQRKVARREAKANGGRYRLPNPYWDAFERDLLAALS